MSNTLFLSAETNEFGQLRKRLAALMQRMKMLHTRHQGDFVARGRFTLETIQQEIEASQVVLHVIGAEAGAIPPDKQVDELLQRLNDFETRFPEIVELARNRQVSYTQWEAWLALYFHKTLCAYRLTDCLPDGATDPSWKATPQSQRNHVTRLAAQKRYAKPVPAESSLYDEIVRTLIELNLLTTQEARRPIWLPYPTLGTLFKGREAFLQQLRASLRRTGKGGATAVVGKAVHGLGGVGKTRVAVEYAWQHAEEHSAVLFVTAESPESLRRDLAEMVGPLLLDLQEQAAEEEVRVAAVVRWLAEHPGWLLILDNVDSKEAAQHVERLLAQLHGGHVLITSRLGTWCDAVEPLELDVLATEDAARFLLERTVPKPSGRGRKPTPDDAALAEELAGELDGLALALEQAGAYIVQKRMPFADYLAVWRSHAPNAHDWSDRTIQYAGPPNAPPRTNAITCQTTLDELRKIDHGEQAVALLNVLAWFAPAPVPLSVLGDPSALSALSASLSFEKEDGTAADSADVEEKTEWSEDSLRKSLAALSDFSMIRWDVEGEIVSVHLVVQDILRTRQVEPQVYLSVALNLPDTDTNRLVEIEPQMRRALAIDEQSYGADHPNVAIRLNNLAQLLRESDNLAEAESLLRRALAIDKQSYGAEHPNVANRLNNLAQLLQDANRLAEAEPLMRRALAIDEQAYGAEHPNVANRLNNLAQLLQDTNRLAEAEPLLRRALAIDEQSYGAEHPNVAVRLNNLAQLLQDRDRLAEAEPLMRRALAIDEQAYGDEHPDVATDLNNLAQLLQDTDRLADAEPLMRRALAIDEQSYGVEHPRVAIDLNNLAQLLQDTNRLADAEPMMRRALAIDEQSYGAEHPDVAIDLNNLARLLQDTNRLAEAEPLMRRALFIFRDSLGVDHPHTQRVGSNLAALVAQRPPA